MAGADIAAKVKAGLSKANAAAGGGSSNVVLERTTVVRDLVNGNTTTVENITLPNALFKTFNQRLIDGTNVKSSDRLLVCDGDNDINLGDYINSDGMRYEVIEPNLSKPFDVTLSYSVHVRLCNGT